MKRKLILPLFVGFLISAQARAGYDPTIGRWLSRDPMNNAELRQGPNLYAYVGNDPVGSIDPLGLFSQAVLNQARQIAISGLLLRQEQLLALQTGDIRQWQQIQNGRTIEGNASFDIAGGNPAVQEWERSADSQWNKYNNVAEIGLLPVGVGLGVYPESELRIALTENEMVRQLLLLLWINQQKPDEGKCLK